MDIKDNGLQQLIEQRIVSIIGSQAVHIARLEAQIIVLEKRIAESLPNESSK